MSGGVDLVIPTYNRRDLVPRAVDSALAQDAPGLSVIVVDDGGTDGTADLLAARYGDRIRLVRKENGGLSSARNAGIRAGTGAFVSFLDDDDVLLPGKLRRQRDALLARPSAGTCFSAGLMVKSWRPRPERVPATVAGRVFPRLLENNFGPPLGYMVRRSLLDEVGGFDESLKSVEDWDLWLRCARAGEVAVDPEPGYVYYVNESNMSRNHETMLHHMLLVFDRHRPHLDAPPGFAEEMRARHMVKFVRRFLAAGNPRRAVEVFREALALSSLSIRLLPAAQLARYLALDERWFRAHAARTAASERAGAVKGVANHLRALVRQAAAGDARGARAIARAFCPRAGGAARRPGAAA